MKKGKDEYLATSDLVEHGVSINEDFANAGLADLWDDATTFTQGLKRRRQVDGRMQHTLCAFERLFGDVS